MNMFFLRQKKQSNESAPLSYSCDSIIKLEIEDKMKVLKYSFVLPLKDSTVKKKSF